ncbi:DUF4153 domain-containing protein [Dactylosporangium sp. CA-139066]|uniref:DUF4153 domain-containing protein n=1 Tax=Dactylosporangium sp. CA-139066 TaxID=3239930 RepID=UPI003D94972A
MALLSPIRLGPPPPTVWQRAWPRRDAAAGRPVLYGALIAALVAAAAIPLDRPGIGWPVAGIALLGALVVALARRGTAKSPEDYVWCAAALALLSVGFFRAAGWLFVLCALTAFGCVALAVGRHRRVPAVLTAPFTLLCAPFRALPWARAGLASTGRPAPAPASTGAAAAGGNNNSLRLLASIGIGVALLIVFGALFASADAAFDRVITAIVPSLDAGTVFRWIFVGVAAGALSLGAAFLAANPSTVGDGEPRPAAPLRRVEWLVPVGAVLVLFVLFVGVQLAVLFGDRRYVMQTVGLTFAEYARKGFWQLLVITLLTLGVMAVAARKAPRATAADRWLLRLVLGPLAACSLVVVGSALWRMNVYEQAYGFTRLRVFVSAFELWLGGLFVLVLLAGLAGLRGRTTWLARAAAGLWVVTLLGLAVLNPDRFIAAHNVDRVDAGNSDIWYLRTLSADAAPELDRLPSGARECALSEIADDLARDGDDWRGWNLGRYQARQIVPEPVTVHDYPCYRRY